MSGGQFKAKIALAAYNSTAAQKILVNGKEIPVVDGLGMYEVGATGVSSNTFVGEIETIDPETGLPTYIKTEPVSWTSFLPSATIAADAMNVLYIGLDNPMSISVPGVTPENTIVSTGAGISLSKKAGGKYVAKVSQVQGNKSYISVSAKMSDGSTRPMGKMEYRIRQVPKPEAFWGSMAAGNYPKQAFLNQRTLNAVLENFVFENVSYRVTRFRFVFISKTKGYLDKSVTGNSLESVKGYISGARPGDMIMIDGIRAIGPGGTERPLNPISFNINN
jgi:gliding motility-associated protein GldM